MPQSKEAAPVIAVSVRTETPRQTERSGMVMVEVTEVPAATGLVIVRSQVCDPEVYRFTSWNAVWLPSPVPIN